MKFNKFALGIVFFLVISEAGSSQPLASGKSKFLGGWTSSSVWSGFDQYWNQTTPGNEGKWGSVESSRNSYNWAPLDAIYNYAVEHGIGHKHHTLIWGSQQPGWITSLDTTNQRLEIEEWIRLVGQRYPKMAMVDVVNEPIHAPPSYKNALGGNGVTGWDWVIRAFQLARQYCAPGVQLILNDYNIIHDYGNTSNYLTIINLLKSRGLIDAIGIQGHYFEFRSHIDGSDGNNYVYDMNTMKSNLDRLAATGLPVYITEFDIDEPNDANQLTSMQVYFPLFWNHAGVKGMSMSGYMQGSVWADHPYTYLLLSGGAERPAMVWLRIFMANGNFRSRQSGNWNTGASWEKNNGTSWVTASVPPVLTDGAIVILNGHTITMTVSDSANKLTVASGATLAVHSGVTLTLKDGNGQDLTVNGMLINSGTFIKDSAATVFIGPGGKYTHQLDGGAVPIATWGVGSTCEITGVSGTMPLNIVQSFSNFTWNCPNQNADVSLGWQKSITIGGTFTVSNTNWNHASTTNPINQLRLFGGSGSCTFNSLVINGSHAALSIQSGGFADTVTITGDVSFSNGGMLSLSKGITGGTICYLKGNVNVADSACIGKSDAANSSRFVFCKGGAQSLTFPPSGVTLVGSPIFIDSSGSTLSLGASGVNGAGLIQVQSGATMNLGTSVIGGSGSFQVQSGATLQSNHSNGLNGNITCTGATGGGNSFKSDATYIFGGSSAQVTGILLPASLTNLTINNSAGVTLSNNTTVTETVEMKNGNIASGINALAYGSTAILKYSSVSAQMTSSGEFPITGGPNNLTIANTTGAPLHASRMITGNLDLVGKLILGSNNFITPSITNANKTRFVVTNGVGSLKRIDVGSSPALFPVGTSVGYASVTVTNTGAVDTMSVRVANDSSSTARVLAKWNINESTIGGGNYNLQFSWIYDIQNEPFIDDRPGNARIYHLPDTLEVGSGSYTSQLDFEPFTLSRGGITTLGSFLVGGFKAPVVGVNKIESSIPQEFSLHQNYPNPFNPSTTISYNVSQQAHVQVTVYNMLGCKIIDLVNEEKSPGYYTIQWDATNVSCGVYFYRLVTSVFTETKKMLLTK